MSIPPVKPNNGGAGGGGGAPVPPPRSASTVKQTGQVRPASINRVFSLVWFSFSFFIWCVSTSFCSFVTLSFHGLVSRLSRCRFFLLKKAGTFNLAQKFRWNLSRSLKLIEKDVESRSFREPVPKIKNSSGAFIDQIKKESRIICQLNRDSLEYFVEILNSFCFSISWKYLKPELGNAMILKISPVLFFFKNLQTPASDQSASGGVDYDNVDIGSTPAKGAAAETAVPFRGRSQTIGDGTGPFFSSFSTFWNFILEKPSPSHADESSFINRRWSTDSNRLGPFYR